MARTAIHPGEVLADELRELAMTPAALAAQIDVPADRLARVVAGKRPINAHLALRLGHWFETSPRMWLNLQHAHDLRVASARAGNAIACLSRRGRDSRPHEADDHSC